MHDLTPWLLGIVASLIAAGVIGVWRLSNSLSALQSTVETWTSVFEQRFGIVADEQNDHGKRIGRIETRVEVHDQQFRNLEARRP